MYELLTTFRPCTVSDEELIRENPILVDLPSWVNLKIFNKPDEIPSNSKYKKYLIDSFEGNRPTFQDYLNASHDKIFVLANSDILIPENILNVISEAQELEFGVCATSRVDVPGHLMNLGYEGCSRYIDYFKNQSLRTIDCFIVNREAMRGIDLCAPGTAGFDNLMLAYCYQNKLAVVDFSEYATVLHSHHEDFRIPFKVNLILNLGDQDTFSDARKNTYSKRWYGGCLSQADYKFKKGGILIKRSAKLKKIRLKCESLRIRIVNKFEKILYKYNLAIWYIAKYIGLKLLPQVGVRLAGSGGFYFLIFSFVNAGDRESSHKLLNDGYEKNMEKLANLLISDHIVK